MLSVRRVVHAARNHPHPRRIGWFDVNRSGLKSLSRRDAFGASREIVRVGAVAAKRTRNTDETTLRMNTLANPRLLACTSREEIAMHPRGAACRVEAIVNNVMNPRARGCAGNATGRRAHNKKKIEWKHLRNCANYVGADVQRSRSRCNKAPARCRIYSHRDERGRARDKSDFKRLRLGSRGHYAMNPRSLLAERILPCSPRRSIEGIAGERRTCRAELC